jgi:hypothetical protein
MNNLWTETINEKGESSLQSHTPKLVAKYCAFQDHVVDNDFPNSRVAVCKKCGKEIPLILGYHEIKDGKILTIELKR